MLLLFTILLFSTGCGKKVQEPVSLTGVPVGIAVAIPRDIKNAESDTNVLKESAVVLSVPADEKFYFGPEQYPIEAIGDKIRGPLEKQPAADRIVYVAVNAAVDYFNLVQILDSVRKEGVRTIGLIVARQPGKDAPSVFKIQILAEPAVDEVLPLKPDPLTLLLSIGADDKVQLNQKPMGNPMDTTNLAQTLTQVLQQRQEHQKAVVIKPQRSTAYGQVVRLIDVAKGAGANPIILQLDDLAL
jgi:biopolymer transport protein ExbD/biopolymer transport protein TolR